MLDQRHLSKASGPAVGEPDPPFADGTTESAKGHLIRSNGEVDQFVSAHR
jgi:hypothetical protein